MRQLWGADGDRPRSDAVADANRACDGAALLDRHLLGSGAEDRASALIAQAGFTLLERNYRCRAGELDIVARRGTMLVVAEVRLRTHAGFGGAAASITASKRARIVRATRYLLLCQPLLATLAVRFDVLLLSSPQGPIEWIEAAFDAAT